MAGDSHARDAADQRARGRRCHRCRYGKKRAHAERAALARADSVSGAWREISAAHAHRTGSARTQHARGATRLARLSNQEAGTDRPAQNVYRHFDARALLRKFSGDDIGACVGESAHAPLFLLAQGTREVARGDYTPKREIRSKDELGFLTQSFNAMTRQLSDARAAVERNRNALEQAKAYLESVLANLSAGVFVFDRQFRLNIANAGAQRILRQSFQPQLSRLLDEITGLNAFGALVRKAFAERAAADADAFADPDHWQHQLEVRVAGETEPLTLLVRGARLLRAPSGAARHSLTSGYVVVFDDISDVISAQRSIAWGEVARRLAHEIKNPLTPIQLSAERLQMKLMHKL